MDDIWELDRALDEEHGNVAPDPNCRVSCRISPRSRGRHELNRMILVARDGREPGECWRPFRGSLKDVCPSKVGERRIVFEKPMRSESTCMNHPFGYAFVIEMHNLFAKMEVLEREGPRSPILREFWSSETGIPCWVVSTGTSRPAIW
jgi:hypothetical protein